MNNPSKKSVDEIIKLFTSEKHDKKLGEKGMAIDPTNNADNITVLKNRIEDIKKVLHKEDTQDRNDSLNFELNRLIEMLDYLELNKTE